MTCYRHTSPPHRQRFNPHTHEGCDELSSTHSKMRISFNPHTHEGCDFYRWSLYIKVYEVSIHTPTKGVTGHTGQRSDRNRCFNPHTHEGCDCVGGGAEPGGICFNPHTHEGCDAIAKTPNFGFACFNPHTHEGCDLSLIHISDELNVSIHTPTNGYTIYHHKIQRKKQFQSTHPRRV